LPRDVPPVVHRRSRQGDPGSPRRDLQAGVLSGPEPVSRALDKVPRDSRSTREAFLLDESGDWEPARFYRTPPHPWLKRDWVSPRLLSRSGRTFGCAIEPWEGFLEDPPVPPTPCGSRPSPIVPWPNGGRDGAGCGDRVDPGPLCLEALVTQSPIGAAAQKLLGRVR
jgi:hypothetical protein